MKLAAAMLIIAYLYVFVRAAGALHNTGLYFGIVMAILTTYNLIREWRDYHHE